MKSTTPPAAVDLMFRAFSDRTRLRLLHLLRGGELCVCDLVAVLDMPQPKVSRHLAYLRRAQLVLVRKDGLWSHYRLAPAATLFHRKLLECLENCFQGVPELAGDAQLLKKIRQRKAACCA
jgi:ArsR family transcriptional regulator